MFRKLIRKRKKYFEEKGIDVIWFVEDRELSIDLKFRVLFRWESEIRSYFNQQTPGQTYLHKNLRSVENRCLFPQFTVPKSQAPPDKPSGGAWDS